VKTRPTGARIIAWAFWIFSLLCPNPTRFVEEPLQSTQSILEESDIFGQSGSFASALVRSMTSRTVTIRDSQSISMEIKLIRPICGNS